MRFNETNIIAGGVEGIAVSGSSTLLSDSSKMLMAFKRKFGNSLFLVTRRRFPREHTFLTLIPQFDNQKLQKHLGKMVNKKRIVQFIVTYISPSAASRKWLFNPTEKNSVSKR